MRCCEGDPSLREETVHGIFMGYSFWNHTCAQNAVSCWSQRIKVSISVSKLWVHPLPPAPRRAGCRVGSVGPSC